MDNLSKIIDRLKRTITDQYLKVTDDVLFTRAHSEYLSEIIEERIQIRKQESNDKIPATKKQIEFLKKLKIEVPFDITKKEASEIIESKMEENKH